MDLANSDADFDSYWEEEARNPHRNRIRIGRQYQATIQPKLKKGESDNRKLEELETLTWCPAKHKLTNDQLDEYFSLAKALSLFARTMQSDEEASINGDQSETEDDLDSSECTFKALKVEVTVPSKEVKSHSVPTWQSKIESIEDPALGLKVATNDLADYVVSRHPETHDAGCDIPATSGHNGLVVDDRSTREAHLFAKALEVCGKNFGAIKKTFLPWKPVKSIIEFYYKGPDPDDQNEDDPGETSKRRQFLSVNSSKSLMPSLNKTSSHSPASNANGTTAKDSEKPLTDSFSEMKGEANSEQLITGEEIKALRAKPIMCKDEGNESSIATPSSMGSLKFYMDGQLVLKLNAKQQAEDKKCEWTESQDTPRLVKPIVKHRKCKLRDVDDSRNSLHRAKSEDTESLDTSDEDSLESSESKSLPSPPSSLAVPKKPKVKSENHSSSQARTSLPAQNISHHHLPISTLASTLDRRKMDHSELYRFRPKSANDSLGKRESAPSNELKAKSKSSSNNDFSLDSRLKWMSGGTVEKRAQSKTSSSPLESAASAPPAAHSSSSKVFSFSTSFDTLPFNIRSDQLASAPVDLTRKPTSHHSAAGK
ncbi:hypothetical protein HDE_12290 [Halotydeus destructor]|nr:hypothetical protein HDE_12290 [Halotydeus destructor]